MDDALFFNLGTVIGFTDSIFFLNHQASKFSKCKLYITPSSPSGDLFHQARKPLSFAHTDNTTMNSTLPSISFRSPRFNLQPAPQPCIQSPRQQGIRSTHSSKPGLSLKPIHAAPGQDANGRLNNANHRGSTLPSPPLSDVIQEFYSSLNEKNSKRLDKVITPDCIVEDTTYYKPLDAKSTRTYFKKLMESMGKNVEFAIDEVCQGGESCAAVMWHLEWNGHIIPFTKGCSFFICSGNGAVLIRKLHIFDESPLKLGKWALEILNIVTSLFNMFPKIAKGFLKDPEAAVQPFVKLYKFYLEPFILPFLAYYTHFWAFVAQGLTAERREKQPAHENQMQAVLDRVVEEGHLWCLAGASKLQELILRSAAAS